MRFYIGKENTSGLEFDSKEEFLDALSECIDEASEKRQKCFAVTVENEE